MQHSKKDLFLVGLLGLQISLHLLGAFHFSSWTFSEQILFIFFQSFLICTNYQCIAHNFIHLPFFKSREMNHLFSILNSLGIGLPQSLYHLHHMNHHRYTNDKKDPQTGTTQDYSSFYRYGKNDQPESIFSYSLFGIWRAPLHTFYLQLLKRKKIWLIHFEIIGFGLFLWLLFTLSKTYFLFGFLPAWFMGQVFALAENYLEHHEATPGDQLRDSVSCYSSWYNFVWFNNGYHQEHHFRPQVHWTKISEVKKEMPDDRRVLNHSHWFNS
jgi:fatty acid desaturase